MLKKGKCVNIGNNCSKALKKEIIEADSFNFKCPECGQTLVDVIGTETNKDPKRVNDPKNGRSGQNTGGDNNKSKIIAAVVALLVVGGGAGAYFMMGGDAPEPVVPVVEEPAKVKPESAPVAEEPAMVEEEPTKVEEVPEPKKEEVKAPLNGKGTIDLGYASYTGDLKNGKPHGYGTLTYKKSQKIVSSKDFVAKPGDTFEGEFRDGKISGLGYWKHDGNQTVVKP